jgi:hypothetical protein
MKFTRSFVRARAYGCLSIFSLSVFCVGSPAFATLGGSAGRIELDRMALHLGTIQTKAVHGYRYEVLASKDLRVTEYINPTTNIVFGVAWRGSRMPKFSVLLGSLPAEAISARTSLHTLVIHGHSLILEAIVSAGSNIGRAVRTDLMPTGVAPSEVMP